MTISAIIIESPSRQRRLDSSQSRPRSLDIVGDDKRSVLEWILHATSKLGIVDTVYVGGYHIEKILETFPRLKVRYHHGRDEEGELGALCCCDRPEGPVMLLSAATVLLPGALERMMSARLARGVYNGNRPTGTYFISADYVGDAFEFARDVLRRDRMAGIEALFSNLPDVSMIALDRLAAPSGDQDAVAKTIFRGKAQTLDNLKPHVRGAVFLPRERVKAECWRADKDAELDKITRAFSGETVIVRSSAASEDGLAYSAAGKYRTVLDVSANDRAAVEQAVDLVLESYSVDGRELDADDEVLIQPQLRRIKASGVLLTRDPRSAAPYFIVNEDRGSNRPDVVTAGSQGTLHQQFVAWSGRNATTVSHEVRRLINVGSELIQLSRMDALDVEYAVDDDDICHLLQVRPLAAARQKSVVADDDILDLIDGSRQFVAERMRPVPGLLGASTVLGVMPDWNPAEMIGSSPRPLALSLYQLLIGENAWADARRRLGYRDLRPEPLIIALGGRPYVDVRASLNSFLPASLDDDIGARWIDACLERLRADPALHDKIEFEIALSCLAPDWELSRRRLCEAGISDEEFAESLRPLTENILSGRVEPIEKQIALLGRLTQLRERHLAANHIGPHGLARRTSHLLADCERFGVVPFSILARYAFIAMNFLRGLLHTGVVERTEYDGFLRSIPTVAGTIANDLGRDLPIAEVVARYGHLRPNSYEITSQNYESAPAQFFRRPATRATVHTVGRAEELLLPKLAAIKDSIARLAIDVSPERLLEFIIGAIAAREYAKFEFMKSLNAALESIAALGQCLGIDRQVMSFLPIDEVRRLATDSLTPADLARLRRRAAFNQKRWEATCAIRLPDVVRKPDEVLAFQLEAWRANFVTRKRIAARAVWLDDTAPREDLAGAIVVTRAADPGYDWIFAHGIAGLITEYGGIGSHMSIRAAEFGLPAAIGCGSLILDSSRGARLIELDCAAEHVKPLL